jgi:integrase
MHPILLDAAGHRRQPVTLPGYHAGRTPRNKGRRYPADPPTVEEIIAVMRTAGSGPDGSRLRALIVVLWRAGLRIGEALALAETDMDPRRGAVLVRHRDGPRGRPAGRHPAPARACPSRGHLDLSAMDRQRGDHRCRPRATPTGDPGHRRSAHHSTNSQNRPRPETILGVRDRTETSDTGSSSPDRDLRRGALLDHGPHPVADRRAADWGAFHVSHTTPAAESRARAAACRIGRLPG